MFTLTERQLREKDYYSQYALKFDINSNVDFSPVTGPLENTERRPWNSYWRTYEIPVELIKDKAQSTEMKLLDFGCGPGDNALRFSHVGYHVTGFDICDENISNCKKVFAHNKSEHRGHFIVSQAEQLNLNDNFFDVVVGIDILHHVDIPRAMFELKRVLKRGGTAVFREPVEAPVFDWIRNTWPVRILFSKQASIEAHITEDERKLSRHDLKVIKAIFPETTIERSLIFSRLDKFLRKKEDKTASVLEKFDHFLCKLFPSWGSLGGAAVIVIRKS